MTEKSRRHLSALILLCFFCIAPAIAEMSNDYWAPWVTKTTTDSATINWRGESNDSGSIDYATSGYFDRHHSFEKTIATQGMTQYQHLQLAGLEPNTSYTYRVRPSGNEDAFDNRTFRTMPVSGPFTFVVVCDSQEGSHYPETKRFKYVADAIAKEQDVLFILLGGDFARFDDEHGWTTFFQVASGMLEESTIFPTIGNHEYHNSDDRKRPTDAVHYRSAFDMPLYYSFDCAGVRFISLNTPDPKNARGDDPRTSPALARSQESWLMQQLNNTMLGTFTIQHHPIWSHDRIAMNPNLAPWENLYHTYNISANFAGHVHNYERFDVSGIPYFIVGTGGGPCTDINSNTHPIGYQFGMTRRLGYLKVTVDPENNTANAQEIFVAQVKGNNDGETPQIYNPPVIADTITFPLKTNVAKSTNVEPNIAERFIKSIPANPIKIIPDKGL